MNWRLYPYEHNHLSNENHPNFANFPYPSQFNGQSPYPKPNISPFQPPQSSSPFAYFQKPRQPSNWPYVQSTQGNYQQSPTQNRPTILTQFQDENGQMDIHKTLATVGQFANTVQQVTPMVKQISDLIKSFR